MQEIENDLVARKAEDGANWENSIDIYIYMSMHETDS